MWAAWRRVKPGDRATHESKEFDFRLDNHIYAKRREPRVVGRERAQLDEIFLRGGKPPPCPREPSQLGPVLGRVAMMVGKAAMVAHFHSAIGQHLEETLGPRYASHGDSLAAAPRVQRCHRRIGRNTLHPADRASTGRHAKSETAVRDHLRSQYDVCPTQSAPRFTKRAGGQDPLAPLACSGQHDVEIPPETAVLKSVIQ